MLPHEAVNLSLSTLIFAYNNHYRTFHSPDVQLIYKDLEIMEVAITSSNDFFILTHNSLLSAFQSHCIILHEAALKYCDMTQYSNEKNDKFRGIKNFIAELRHAHAHMGTKFLRFTWGLGLQGNKKPFRFTIHIPVVKNSNGITYNPESKLTHKITFQGTPGRELRITEKFILKIILLSFHFRKIFAFRKISTCDEYLSYYKSNWQLRR